jgi:hypothetical protein
VFIQSEKYLDSLGHQIFGEEFKADFPFLVPGVLEMGEANEDGNCSASVRVRSSDENKI